MKQGGGPHAACRLQQHHHAQHQDRANMQAASAAMTQTPSRRRIPPTPCTFPRWTSRLVGLQVSMPTDNTQHPIPPRRTHPPPSGDTDTEDMLQHPSDWTRCRATQPERSEAEHIGSVRVAEIRLAHSDRTLWVQPGSHHGHN